MNRTPVTSSNVSSIGWGVATAVLEVEFHGGSVYQYEKVPESVYLGILNADSPGEYHHQHIRGVYPYQRIR